MATSVEYRQEEMSIKETEKSDDLSLFIDFDAANLNLEVTLDSESENPLMPDTRSIINGPDPGADDILNSENTTDYDWLLSPPRNTAPSLEMEHQKIVISHNQISNGQSTSPESGHENIPVDTTANIAPKLPASANGVKSSNATIRRPSPSRKASSTGSRSSTPTTRPVVPSTTKPLRSSTPTSRATVAAIKPVPPSKRSVTPTARPSIISAASKSTSRSSNPTARPSISAAKSASRSSTPTIRPSIISASKSTSRSSTPTSRPSNPSGLLNTSVNGGKPSSAMKVVAPSCSSSISVKSRPSRNPPETLQTVKKSVPERSASASKERPGPPTVKLNVTDSNFKAVPKRTSCSPSRGQVSNGSVKPGVMRSSGYSNGNDDVNPVLMGTKMVERVVNMRKLAPPREDHVSDQNIASGKLSVSQEKGFGRSRREDHGSQSKFRMANNVGADADRIYESIEILIVKHEDIRGEQVFSPSIYKVPETLRNVSPNSYTPRVVSIGPFHKDVKSLKEVEMHKVNYLRDLSHRVKSPRKQTMKECVNMVLSKLAQIKACYEGEMKKIYNDDELAQMMVCCINLNQNERESKAQELVSFNM